MKQHKINALTDMKMGKKIFIDNGSIDSVTLIFDNITDNILDDRGNISNTWFSLLPFDFNYRLVGQI